MWNKKILEGENMEMNKCKSKKCQRELPRAMVARFVNIVEIYMPRDKDGIKEWVLWEALKFLF